MTSQALADTRRAPSGWRLWYMVAVLCSTNTVAFIDRGSLQLLAPQITRDLGISDSQMGLLIGPAFALTYLGLSVPAGMLVDRFARRRLMSMAITFWAFATILSGFAAAFLPLLVGRLAIGGGEAMGGPGSMSIIRDAVPPEKRGRSVAIWAMGANIGGAIAFLAGGAILASIGDALSVTLPVVGALRSWQLVLMVSGLLAIPVAFLMFSFPEPVRAAASAGDGVGLGAALSYMGSRWPVFLPLFIVNGVCIVITVGSGLWTATMFQRVFHVPRPMVGLNLGLMNLFLAMPSQFLSGIVMDWLEKRGVKNPIPLFGAIVTAVIFGLGVSFPLAGDAATAWALLGAYLLIGTCTFTIGTALVTRLSPRDMVGKISATHFMWVGFLGTFVGGVLYPGVSDAFFSAQGDKAISYAIATVIGALDVVAFLGYAVLTLTTRRELAKPGSGALPR